ncbi:MAG: hypothetical protein MK172_06090 [Verrucomicrobiales bacterium]|nr:hypothetical protein [Verrucomicrobiales bacterium]
MSKKKTATPAKGSILTEEMLRARLAPIKHFDSITPAAAEILAGEGSHRYTGWMENDDDLKWLKNISNEVAVQLGKSKEWYRLDLNGLESLSDEAAEGLAKFKGEGGLSLNGLSVLSDKAAKALAKIKGKELSLNSLSSLSDRAAEGLGKFRGEKLLIGGRNISGEHDEDGEDTEIWGGALSELSDKAAEALAEFKGEKLYLNGVISLTDKAAEALAKCKAGLFLNGIESLSDVAAETLAGRKGSVELQGLNELSEQGALSFSKNKSLVVSDQLAKRIADVVKNHAKTTSTLTSKDQSKIRKLITSEDPDNLDFACNLLASLNASEGDWLKLFPKTRVQKLLSNWEEPKIWNTLVSAMKPHARLFEELKLQAEKRVNTTSYDWEVRNRYSQFLTYLIKVANDDVIAVLSLVREGLKYLSNKISDTAAMKLANYKGALYMDIESLADTPGHIALAAGASEVLELENLKELSTKAAEALAARKQEGFVFNEIENLTADTAAALAKFKGESLRFYGLTTLEADAAKHLAKYKGDLSIYGTLLSDEAIAELANKKGQLGLTIASGKAVKALASHEGELHLSADYDHENDRHFPIALSKAVAEALSKHKGKINYTDAREWVESHYSKEEECLVVEE